MWQALRAELAYSRGYLLGGLGIAVGVVLVVSAVFVSAGGEGPPGSTADGIRAMFLIMAPMIVSFVVQGLRGEERRARLLLSGSLTPRQIAGAMVLLPVVLFGIGVAAAAMAVTVGALVRGALETETLHLAGYVGGFFLVISLLVLEAQEATAAHRQQRRRAAIVGWAGFAVAVTLLIASENAAFMLRGPWSWPSLHATNLVVALSAMLITVALYARRTDFTR